MTDRSREHQILIWSPALIGFILPLTTSVGVLAAMGGYSRILQLFTDDVQEIAPMVLGAAIISVPFCLASMLTKQDLASDLAYRKILIRWSVRFLPVLAWYLFLLINMIMASVKGLPGASTSAISMLTVPFFGVPAVLLSHWIIDKIQKG